MADDDKWTLQELVERAEWEGGLYELVTGWGVVRDVLRDDVDPAARYAYERFWDLAHKAAYYEELLESAAEDDDE